MCTFVWLISITCHVRDLLHTKKRRDETCEHISDEIGVDCISCELKLAGPEFVSQPGFSSLPKAVCEELFCCELSDREACSQAISPDINKVKKATITVDNYLSPAHTLLQIQCIDQKGLIYDILRTAKDCNIQVTCTFLYPSPHQCEGSLVFSFFFFFLFLLFLLFFIKSDSFI